jgi:hypothetical protein
MLWLNRLAIRPPLPPVRAKAIVKALRSFHGLGVPPNCFGVAHGQPAHIRCALVQAARKLARLFPCFQMRLDFGLDEPARGVLYRCDVFRANVQIV